MDKTIELAQDLKREKEIAEVQRITIELLNLDLEMKNKYIMDINRRMRKLEGKVADYERLMSG